MKIVCFIDSLVSGGAQRQVCALAVLLKRRGFQIQVLTYHEINFFADLLERESVPYKKVDSNSKINRILSVRKELREIQPEVVISFLNIPSLIAEISGLPFKKYKLIVSERNVEYQGVTFKFLLRCLSHLFADAVVPNSFAKTEFIRKNAPWLKRKTQTIPNCVDLDYFKPTEKDRCYQSNDLKVLVVGRLEPQKNPLALIAALKILKKKWPEINLTIDWYGNNFFYDGKPTDKSWLFLKMKNAIDDLGVSDCFRIHAPHQNIVELYHASTVVCLPSLWEGCSNVICEAMACGRPVLASHVGDNAVLVKDGENGFLFDPESPEEIAESIQRFACLSMEEKERMGRRNRERAEQMFSPSVFVDRYIAIIEKILQ